MKLKYKISAVITLFVVVTFSLFIISYIITDRKKIIEKSKLLMSGHATSMSEDISNQLKAKLDISKTLSSSTLVEILLQQSNMSFKKIDLQKREDLIAFLDKSWKSAGDKNDEFVKPYLNNKLADYLKSQKKVLPNEYGEIFITNKYGVLVASTGKLSTLSHAYKYWWKGAYDEGRGKFFIDDRGYDDSVDGYVIGIVVPIKKDGEIIGILKSNVNIINFLNKSARYYESIKEGKLQIARSKGLIILEKDKEPLSTNLDVKLLKYFNNKSNSVLFEDKIVSFAPIEVDLIDKDVLFGGKQSSIDHKKGNKNETWYIVISQDIKSILVEHNENTQFIVIAGLVFVVLLALISFYLGTIISKPIENLSKSLMLIKDTNHYEVVEVASNDEVGKLTTTFNSLMQKLHNTMISKNELSKEVQKSAELVNLVQHSINEIYIFDTNSFKFLFVNQSVLKNTGYSLDEMLNQIPIDIKPLINEKDFKQILKPLIEKQKEHVVFSTLHQRKDKTIYPVDIILQYGQYENKKCFIAMAMDVSERNKMLKEIQDRDKIMIAQSRHAAMGEMIGMIAHQWRQPISIIAMGANNIIADIQLDTVRDEELIKVSNDILEETEYLSKTIDDFRNFFKPDKSAEYVSIEDVYKEAYKIIGKSLENSNILVESCSDTSVQIETYSRELLQVIINILKNSKEALIEFREKDRLIRVKIEELEDRVVLMIGDNAGGIDEDIIDKIFDPYFSTKDEKTGTGLGLYMSKTIIEKHLKGTINTTNIDGGVEFTITLPIKIGIWDRREGKING